ncbi:ZIP zinc transporter-domain-containing protein [Thamnidium elegans]|uniref:Zinc transporter ZIP9 n=1 Tax=Thamnidium elegans TaxID=101142 RepID=A0A8H7SZT8_9FUNG|nr:hypothetical protein INT48_006641 [Thamnidium elegans]KAI8077070.1 ZIP zinc transporter-domain-containing protein [Thamnidium elegans]
MLNAFVWLLLLCIAMLVSSFVAGCVPLATKLSDSKLHYLTSVSVGLLISTSLVVIIPEGVETLYKQHLAQQMATNHTAVGISLLVGFALMFVIDQVSSMHVHQEATTSKESNSVTIGLIVHAAADGIALGASVTDPQLSMVVFFAIMLHKAPSAFALTTVLLSEGVLSRSAVRQHLLLFSVAAPAGSISTYLLLQLFKEQFDALSLEYWTGILLLFSGGTFLYVAMHSIQELPKKKNVCWYQLSAIVVGMVVPFLLNLNHSH